MLHQLDIRTFSRVGAWLLAGAAFVSFLGAASAQSGDPIKIGYGISQTGGLAPNGKSALLAQQIWEEDINAKGGLLGRPVKLVYYDDQTNPATVPSLYQKLLDVDKVDIVIGGYGTNLLAPAMPVVIQKKKMLIGLFGMAVNTEFNYPKYFSMIPLGPTPKAAMSKVSSKPPSLSLRNRRPSQSWRPMPNSRSTARKARARTSRRPVSRSSTTSAIRRRPPTSRRSCGRFRGPIRTSSSSSPIRRTRSDSCVRSTRSATNRR